MTLLKEEINEAQNTIVSLSKWRLLIIGILTAAGLGWSDPLKLFPHGYLALFIVPYVCVYVDFLIYERITVIYEIAKYLRQYDGNDEEMLILRAYERYVNVRRKQGLSTGFTRWANVAMSLSIGAIVPLLAFAIPDYTSYIAAHLWTLLIPAVGLLIALRIFVYHRKRYRQMEENVA